MKKIAFIVLSALMSVMSDAMASEYVGGGLPAVDYGYASPESDSVYVKKKFMPVRGRIDRGIDKISFVYKGEIALGLSASYGTLSSEDTDFMLLIDNLDLKGNYFTVNPSVGYFVADNICVGARFGYSKTNGKLGNLSLDLGPDNDMSMSLKNVSLVNQMMTMGIFSRSYAGIDPKGHFGLYAELELLYKTGFSNMSYTSEDVLKSTRSSNYQLELALNTGLAVYIFPNVCANISFGLGGLSYNRVVQKDDKGDVTGTRSASKMLWKLNLLDIKIGFNLHL